MFIVIRQWDFVVVCFAISLTLYVTDTETKPSSCESLWDFL